tara:strand:- start:1 stop:465 length:465 start_codon:yes stop_codon:yes gene_type:complete
MNITDKLNFLQIQEITTDKQKANGTREFKLPVRDQYGAAIHVASFASGYVRRTKAGGYCPSWQLNKTKTVPPTKDYKWPSRERILILDEEARLDYLIAFCLKNYYIKQSNMLSSGEFIPTWKHVDELNHVKERYDVDQDLEVKVIVNGQRYNII